MKKEKKIIGSPDPVNILCTKRILEQMMNYICKIKTNHIIGTGFFCKIPIEDGKIMDCLMTNHHVIDEKLYNENKEIYLLLNDEKEIKKINLITNRIVYFNEDYDIAIIELKKEDEIKNFLELDKDLFIDEIKAKYEDKSIYVIQYPNGKNAVVSYGLLNKINNYEIKHTCSTDFGSSSSPILNLEVNTLIGIHREASPNFNFNIGTFLKFPLIEFIAKNKTKIGISLAVRRLKLEYKNYWKENKDDHFIISPIDESNIYKWFFIFKGPKDSPYDGGLFHLRVDFPYSYPFEPPKFCFITKIFHPNVNSYNGKVCNCCLGLKNYWSPGIFLKDFFTKFIDFIKNPKSEYCGVSNIKAQDLLRENREKFVSVAKEWTEKYAK